MSNALAQPQNSFSTLTLNGFEGFEADVHAERLIEAILNNRIAHGKDLGMSYNDMDKAVAAPEFRAGYAAEYVKGVRQFLEEEHDLDLPSLALAGVGEDGAIHAQIDHEDIDTLFEQLPNGGEGIDVNTVDPEDLGELLEVLTGGWDDDQVMRYRQNLTEMVFNNMPAEERGVLRLQKRAATPMNHKKIPDLNYSEPDPQKYNSPFSFDEEADELDMEELRF